MDTETGPDAVTLWRIEQLEEMKFTRKEAELLAGAKDELGFSLHLARVKQALDNGCGHKMAVRIFG